MRTTPAPERGAGSDDPTGPRLWQDRPAGNLGEGIVRTSFSVPTGLRFNSPSFGFRSSSRRRPEARAPAGNAQRRATRLTPSTAIVPIGAVGAGLGGAVATGGANAGRNHGRKQGLAPDPTGGAASRRDPNEKAVVVRWVVDAVCCGSLGCRAESGLLSVTVAGEERVLCVDHVEEFIEERSA